jgi:hypothetical protein
VLAAAALRPRDADVDRLVSFDLTATKGGAASSGAASGGGRPAVAPLRTLAAAAPAAATRSVMLAPAPAPAPFGVAIGGPQRTMAMGGGPHAGGWGAPMGAVMAMAPGSGGMTTMQQQQQQLAPGMLPPAPSMGGFPF